MYSVYYSIYSSSDRIENCWGEEKNSLLLEPKMYGEAVWHTVAAENENNFKKTVGTLV